MEGDRCGESGRVEGVQQCSECFGAAGVAKLPVQCFGQRLSAGWVVRCSSTLTGPGQTLGRRPTMIIEFVTGIVAIGS